MWVWDERRNDWVWLEKPGRFGLLQVILLILVAIFLIWVLFPGKIDEWRRKEGLLPPFPQQLTQQAPVVVPQPVYEPTQVQPQILPQEPVYLVVTATPRPGWDVPITPEVNPYYQGPARTEPPVPSILEWRPGNPLPTPMGPPLPPGWGNPYP